MNLSQYKAKYNLNDVPDEVLADKLYEQYGKGAPKEEFYSKLQYAPQQAANAPMQQEHKSFGQGVQEGFENFIPHAGQMAKGITEGLYDIFNGQNQDIDRFIAEKRGDKELPRGKYSQEEQLRDIASGLMKGARFVGNAPGNAINYLGEEFYGDNPDVNIPDFTLPDSVNQFDVDAFTGAKGGRPASDLIQGAASFAPALAASFGNPFLAAGVHATGRNENPLTDILMTALGHGASQFIKEPIKSTQREIAALKEQPGHTLTELKRIGNAAIEAPTKIINAVTPKSFKDVNMLEESIAKLKQEQTATKESKRGEQSAAAKVFGEDYEKLLETEEAGNATTNEMIPKTERANRTELLERNKEAYNAVEQSFDEAYQSINEGPGSKEMGHPLQLDADTLEVYSPAIQAFGEAGPVASSLMQKILTRPNLKVSDYINFRRKIRNLKNQYTRLAKQEGIEPGLEDQYRSVRDNLAQLETDVLDRLEVSMGPQDYKQLRHIDDQYSNIATPFQENQFLYEGAVKDKGNIIVNDFRKAVNELGKGQLSELFETSDAWKNAAAKHDLMGKDLTSIKAIDEALSGDAGRALPTEMRKHLEKQKATLLEKEKVETALSKIKSSRLTRLTDAPELRRLFRDRPDLTEPLKNIEDLQERLEDIQRQLQEQGLSLETAKKKTTAWKAALVTVAGLAGLSKFLGAL